MTGGYASYLRRSLKRKKGSAGKAQPFRTVRRQSRTGSLSGEKKAKRRKGAAFPHCAAAEPRWFIEWRLGNLIEWRIENIRLFRHWAVRADLECIAQSTSAARRHQ